MSTSQNCNQKDLQQKNTQSIKPPRRNVTDHDYILPVFPSPKNTISVGDPSTDNTDPLLGFTPQKAPCGCFMVAHFAAYNFLPEFSRFFGASANKAPKRTRPHIWQWHPAAAPAPKLPSAHSSGTLQRHRTCTHAALPTIIDIPK